MKMAAAAAKLKMHGDERGTSQNLL